MVGASRCIAATLFKFGGPKTLLQATPSLCVSTADFRLPPRVPMRFDAESCPACRVVLPIKNRFRAMSGKRFLPLPEAAQGARAHVQGREATALFAAAA